MNAFDQTRPVWLNRDQRRHLTQMGTLADRHGFPVLQQMADEVAAAWDAAPDPVEAVRAVLPERVFIAHVDAVLRALGMPEVTS